MKATEWRRKCFVALLAAALVRATGGLAAENIHGIDFRNSAYAPACLSTDTGETQTVQVVSGAFYGHTKGGTSAEDFLDFTVEQIEFGDLTGDGNEEAVVVTRCNTGGSGVFTEALVYGIQDGTLRLLCRVIGGDRASGGIHSATVERDLLRLEVFGTKRGACCPQWIEVRNYRLKGGQSEQVGSSRRMKYVRPSYR